MLQRYRRWVVAVKRNCLYLQAQRNPTNEDSGKALVNLKYEDLAGREWIDDKIVEEKNWSKDGGWKTWKLCGRTPGHYGIGTLAFLIHCGKSDQAIRSILTSLWTYSAHCIQQYKHRISHWWKSECYHQNVMIQNVKVLSLLSSTASISSSPSLLTSDSSIIKTIGNKVDISLKDHSDCELKAHLQESKLLQDVKSIKGNKCFLIKMKELELRISNSKFSSQVLYWQTQRRWRAIGRIFPSRDSNIAEIQILDILEYL